MGEKELSDTIAISKLSWNLRLNELKDKRHLRGSHVRGNLLDLGNPGLPKNIHWEINYE